MQHCCIEIVYFVTLSEIPRSLRSIRMTDGEGLKMTVSIAKRLLALPYTRAFRGGNSKPGYIYERIAKHPAAHEAISGLPPYPEAHCYCHTWATGYS